MAAAVLVATAAAAWGAGAASPRGAAAAAATALCACAAMASDAGGGALLRAALWQGILRQTRRDMTRETIGFWQRPGGAGAPASEFLVAEVAGAVVGCVAVLSQHTLYKERRAAAGADAGARAREASVWRLSVSPAARRLGVGRALMAAAEAWAAARGCTHVSLVTGNAASQKFYRSIGYGIEDEARARQVLFGASGEPADVRGWLQRRMLRSRVGARGTVFCKLLGAAPPPAEQRGFSFAWLAGARVLDDAAGAAARAAFDALVAAGAAAAAGCAEAGAGRALAEAVFLAGPAPLAAHRTHLLCLVPGLSADAVDAQLPTMVAAAAQLQEWRRSAARAARA